MMESKLLDESWLEKLPDPIVDSLSNLNEEIIGIMCDRIKAIGGLLPTDANRLSNALEFAGADLREIEQAIRRQNQLNKKEVRKIFEEVAKENERFAAKYYQYRGLLPVQVRNDDYLDSLLQSVIKNTSGELTNLSDTYAFKFPGQKAMPLRRAYTKVIDKAIYEVQNGVLDYNTAMRNTVRELADSGIRTINWESGVTRRADSAARMNILDGVRRFNQEMMHYNGEKFGSDGVELSAHAISAPDHLPVQGRQFTNEQFDRMQSGLDCEDVNGNHYEGFDRPIGEWNCKHFVFPIVIGVSEPAYTDEQLNGMAQSSREKYDITQQQRKKETELRRLKDRRMAFSRSGNELDAKRTQREIDAKQREYNAFCKKNGISPKPDRTRVPGYKRVSTKGLQDLENRDILKAKVESGQLSLTINAEKQDRHILGSKDYVQGRSYLTVSVHELQEIVNNSYGSGKVTLSNNRQQIREVVFLDKTIGVDIDMNGNEFKTNGIKIHYSKTGTHIVPHRRKDENGSDT